MKIPPLVFPLLFCHFLFFVCLNSFHLFFCSERFWWSRLAFCGLRKRRNDFDGMEGSFLDIINSIHVYPTPCDLFDVALCALLFPREMKSGS